MFSGFYPFDVYFPEDNLVVEINGSTHFYNLSDNLLPKYRLKEQVFQELGIKYVNINYYEVLDSEKNIIKEKIQQIMSKALMDQTQAATAPGIICRKLCADDNEY